MTIPTDRLTWKLVPGEPTPEMLAAFDHVSEWLTTNKDGIKYAAQAAMDAARGEPYYRAMLAASPPPPEPVSEGVTEAAITAALDAYPFADENRATRVWQHIEGNCEDAVAVMRAALRAAFPALIAEREMRSRAERAEHFSEIVTKGIAGQVAELEQRAERAEAALREADDLVRRLAPRIDDAARQ